MATACEHEDPSGYIREEESFKPACGCSATLQQRTNHTATTPTQWLKTGHWLQWKIFRAHIYKSCECLFLFHCIFLQNKKLMNYNKIAWLLLLFLAKTTLSLFNPSNNPEKMAFLLIFTIIVSVAYLFGEIILGGINMDKIHIVWYEGIISGKNNPKHEAFGHATKH